MPFGIPDNSFEHIINIFSKYKDIDKAVLFGSRALGTHKKGSDIDISLFSDTLSLNKLNKLRIELDDLMLPYIFDLLNYKQIQNDELIDHIKRVGVEIYKKN